MEVIVLDSSDDEVVELPQPVAAAVMPCHEDSRSMSSPAARGRQQAEPTPEPNDGLTNTTHAAASGDSNTSDHTAAINLTEEFSENLDGECAKGQQVIDQLQLSSEEEGPSTPLSIRMMYRGSRMINETILDDDDGVVPVTYMGRSPSRISSMRPTGGRVFSSPYTNTTSLTPINLYDNYETLEEESDEPEEESDEREEDSDEPILSLEELRRKRQEFQLREQHGEQSDEEETTSSFQSSSDDVSFHTCDEEGSVEGRTTRRGIVKEEQQQLDAKATMSAEQAWWEAVEGELKKTQSDLKPEKLVSSFQQVTRQSRYASLVGDIPRLRSSSFTSKRERSVKMDVHDLEHDDDELDESMDMGFQGGVDPPCEYDMGREMGVMSRIEHLTDRRIDPHTGLPRESFAVFGACPDSMMYEFEMHVGTSEIPNSGRGVFLTFLGARELKPSRRRRAKRLLDAREEETARKSQSQEPVMATTCAGYGMSVLLTGEHLWETYNTLLPLPKLYADREGDEPMRLKFNDPTLPFYEDELEGLKPDNDRIGFLGLHHYDDFVVAKKRHFCSTHPQCALINLGRYGPFRSCEQLFDIKSFLFLNEPSVWSFGVNEGIRFGSNKRCVRQVIDITEDTTGEVHSIAQNNLMMYVNEVGHNKRLENSVHAYTKDERTVEYYLRIDNPMTPGETREIYVDYFETYEATRTRKGYGAAGQKSDDHLPSFLQRNFDARLHVMEIMNLLEVMQLYLTVEYLVDIATHIIELFRGFLDGEVSTFPGTLQLIALRRLCWLRHHLEENLASFRMSAAASTASDRCREVIPLLTWTEWDGIFDAVTNTEKLKPHRDVLHREVIEECTFAVRDTLREPMDETVWCEVSRKLQSGLCQAIAHQLWSSMSPTRDAFSDLFAEFHKLAAEAATQIRQDDTFQSLTFTGAVRWQMRTDFTPRNGKEADPWLIISTSDEDSYAAERLCDLGTSSAPNYQWYTCWQVFFVVHTFASHFLPDEVYSSVQKEQMCNTLGLNAASTFQEIENGMSLGALPTKRKKDLKKQKNRRDTRKARKVRRPRPTPTSIKEHSFLFWRTIWLKLTAECHWNLDIQKKAYFFPPRVKRGKPFKCREHYFDSMAQVLEFVANDPTWAANAVAQEGLKLYWDCVKLYESVKDTSEWPSTIKKEDQVEWLKERVSRS